MKAAALTFWSDEQGFLISAELVIILTLGVLGLIVGISSLQSALVFELNNLCFAFASLNQSYFVNGFAGCKGSFFASSGFFNNFNNSCLFLGTTGGGFNNGFVGNGFGGGGGFYASDIGVGSGGGYVAPSTAVAAPAPVTPITPAPCSPTTTPCPADAPCPQENCPTGTSVNGPAVETTPLKPVPFGPYPGPNLR